MNNIFLSNDYVFLWVFFFYCKLKPNIDSCDDNRYQMTVGTNPDPGQSQLECQTDLTGIKVHPTFPNNQIWNVENPPPHNKRTRIQHILSVSSQTGGINVEKTSEEHFKSVLTWLFWACVGNAWHPQRKCSLHGQKPTNI